MGQYYRPVTKEINRKGKEITHYYNRELDGKYTMAKLMEHSWWNNPMVNAIAQKLFRHPMKIAWVGDYADSYEEGEIPNGLKKKEVDTLCKKTWEAKGLGVQETGFNLINLFLCNHSKREYLDCYDYYERMRKTAQKGEEAWVVHPLPLLTALGNGFGGGDYRKDSIDVGYWALDLISIETIPPTDYTQCLYSFPQD